ncbi:MAG: imidazole glycerol phosphate synthase subunit HisH [Firmicutes bacterium]|nr:imidazole glycerol phosphate synthase subunit HisH [Bacillota bacterium]
MIAIIDYGMGNLRSVQKGFEYVGYQAEITNEPTKILNASQVVLPGVGAFSDAMDSLHATGMVEIIKQIVKMNKPFLGICLGMQLLLDRSFEGGTIEGLALIKGDVKRIPQVPGLKVPHMGWNELKYKENPLFKGLRPDPTVYFVHSYYVDSAEKDCVIGTTDYGSEIQVAVNKGSVYGLQFHPEKSGDTGLQILRNFGGLL